LTNALYGDPALAQFYDLVNRWHVDFDFCVKIAEEALSVLDLGCGTGELAVALARDRSVTAVDPAAAMLEIGRKREGGGAVTWVVGDARTLRLDRRFDLVLLTGHAFQVFLSDADQTSALATIAAHLAPGGSFIFDTRNPAAPIGKTRHRAETVRRFVHPALGQVEAWSESRFDEARQVLSYVNGYRTLATGEEHSAPAEIRYTAQPELATRIAAAGLRVDKWLGDWGGMPFRPDSREIIPIGRLA
jgi:ubiquinone/menaquinone biosynthesis C-methylase UbiE